MQATAFEQEEPVPWDMPTSVEDKKYGCISAGWRKDKASSKSSNCCVVNCNNAVFPASAVATSDELQHAFDSTGLKCGSEVIPTPTPLRKHHYHVVYGELQSRQK